jgi:hypothetical protein
MTMMSWDLVMNLFCLIYRGRTGGAASRIDALKLGNMKGDQVNCLINHQSLDVMTQFSPPDSSA